MGKLFELNKINKNDYSRKKSKRVSYTEENENYIDLFNASKRVIHGQNLNNEIKNNARDIIKNTLGKNAKKHKEHLGNIAATAKDKIDIPSNKAESSTHQNLKGSLSDGALFPGIELIKDEQGNCTNYKIIDKEIFVEEIKKMYKLNAKSKHDETMHPYIEEILDDHIESNGGEFTVFVGIPALHAEVRALNDILNQISPGKIPPPKVLANIQVATYKLAPGTNEEIMPQQHFYKGRFYVTVYDGKSSNFLERSNKEKDPLNEKGDQLKKEAVLWIFDLKKGGWIKADMLDEVEKTAQEAQDAQKLKGKKWDEKKETTKKKAEEALEKAQGIPRPGAQGGPFVACSNCQAFLKSTRILTDIKREPHGVNKGN